MRREDQYEEQRRWCDLVHEEPGQDVFENLQLVFMENEVDLLCAAPGVNLNPYTKVTLKTSPSTQSQENAKRLPLISLPVTQLLKLLL